MKLTQKEQAIINNYKTLFDPSCRHDINNICLNSSTTQEHQKRVNEICMALYYELKTPFFTDIKFRTGYRPDIFCPLYLGGSIIEIRKSETEKDSKAKLDSMPIPLRAITIIYIDCKKEFKLKDIQ